MAGGHRTTILFPENLWEAVQECAEKQGESGSAYIREAVTARLFYDWGKAGEDVFSQALKLAKQIEKGS